MIEDKSYYGRWVTRDLHVSASPRECIRHVLQKVDKRNLHRRGVMRRHRHALLRAALIAHQEHRDFVLLVLQSRL